MLVILALIITPIFGCNYKTIHYHAYDDPESPFKDLPNIDIMNWDDSLLIFGNGFEVQLQSEKTAGSLNKYCINRATFTWDT